MENKPQNNSNPITPLAITNWRDIRKAFGVKQKNRRGHIYVLGKTGTGKSTLLLNMLISDIQQGYGIALIDPHGDLAEDLLDFIPQSRIQDVIYFNPADIEYPIAFNPLEKAHQDEQHLVVSGLISTFKKIWPEFWGPRLEHILRHALFTLLEYPNSTLLDVPKLLTDRDFRVEVLAHVTHTQVRDFWFNEFERYSKWLQSEAVSPILNKMGQFLTTLPLRNIVGQSENTFDLRKVMDEGKILIVNLAKGKIGEDTSALLGALLVTMIQLTALSRADIPEPQRRAFYLYVDEIQNILTLSFADMLSESRKYGLNLTLSHQFINQLDERLRNAIFGNVGTIISFRIGVEDAEYLTKEFGYIFREGDFVNLPNYHIYLKLMIDGKTSDPFSGVTLPVPEKSTPYKKKIIQMSRREYSGTRKEVELKIIGKVTVLNETIEVNNTTRQIRLFN